MSESVRLDATRAKAAAATVVVAIAVVAAIASWWIGSRREAEHAVNAGASVHDDARNRGIATAGNSMPASPMLERLADSLHEPSFRPEVESESPASANANEIRPLEGRLIFVDAEGRERLDAEGSISYFVEGSESPRICGEFAVESGAFHLEFRGDLQFDLVSARIGSALAELDVGSLSGNRESPVVIHARAVRPFRVRFIDAVSGADVRGVGVVRDEGDTRHDDTLETVAPESVLFPWPNWDELEVRPLGHDGKCMDQLQDVQGNRVLEVTRPGRYRVTLPAFPGLEPVPAFEIDVAAGDSTFHKIEVRRKGS